MKPLARVGFSLNFRNKNAKNSISQATTSLMQTNLFKMAAVCFVLVSLNAPATTSYVDSSNANPLFPYHSWSTAATNIQDAISTASPGDTVLVTNGIYQYAGDSLNGSNRVDLISNLQVQSVNGPAVTVIQGYQVPGTTNGANAVRCAYLNNGATLSGFTLTGGATQISGAGNGGGVYCASKSCVVSNCIITGNCAYEFGGGAYSGSLANCIISTNIASNGGGVAESIVNDSLLVGNGNTSTSGGAAYISTLNNCTLVGNLSGGLGAADGCTLNNSIIYYNFNGFYADCYQCILTNCCTTLGNGNFSLSNNSISNSPGFVDMAHGNYRLQIGSPCIDAGTNLYAPAGPDLDGSPRIFNGTVDMGAYESEYTNTVHYVSLTNTIPAAPYTNWLTAATNLQDAVAVAQTGEFVVVASGIYKYGGGAVYGQMTNRVALTNAITLLGLNGPSSTVIVGSTVGNQTRCVYVGSNAVLTGFTLVDGTTRTSGDLIKEESGGGAWCEPSGVISNCVIGGNSFPYANGGTPSDGCTASWEGGAVYGGTIYNSTLSYNTTSANGGAAAAANLFNCLVINNTSSGGYSSGIYQGMASNCTFSANVGNSSAWPRAGGAYQSMLYNCLLISNRCYIGGASQCTNYNCTFVANSGTEGGGVLGGVLYNCVLSNNTALYSGGGAFQSALYNCLITSNLVTSANDYGGGAYSCLLYNCVVSRNYAPNGGGLFGGTNYNCLISSNSANGGGGVSQGTFYNCLLTDNTANFGGGANQGTLYNCIISGNTANVGGGANSSALYNCTVVSNTATVSGNSVASGVGGGTAYNSIIYYNSSPGNTNYVNCILNYCDTVPDPGGNGNITNEPAFVNLAGGDFHLQSMSPCINSGDNLYVTPTNDYDGNPRIVALTVDMGAYEYQTPSSVLSYAWAQQYGLPTDGSVDYSDLDGTGMSNWQKWIAGLNPNDPTSVLAMLSPPATNNSSGVTVSWQSVANRNYFLQRSLDLTTQPAFTSIQSNIVGQVGTTSYTDADATNAGPYFYRVGVQ
jgi:hypothetical protein